MNFKQAINQLEKGNKVRRPCWDEDSYWILGVDDKICWKDGNTAHIHLDQIKATDWEIIEEKKESLSDKLAGRDIDGFVKKNVKEKIQNAQRRLKTEILKPTKRWNHVEKIIDKVFKEEFGDKLV